MTKGIDVECRCCGTTQEVTEMVAHDIFGFSLDQVQHILHDYREQVPYADAIARRIQIDGHTRAIMLDLLQRVISEDDLVSLDARVDVVRFLMDVGVDMGKR